MPSQPSSGRPATLAQRVGRAYPRREWELLTSLPREVVVAAVALRADRPPSAVAEGLAGLDAIAAGRFSDSDLVRAVAAAIYAETPATAGLAAATGSSGPEVVLGDCRTATAALAVRTDPADSAAYRQWLQHVAARVCGAGRVGRPVAGDAERAYLAALGAALGLR